MAKGEQRNKQYLWVNKDVNALSLSSSDRVESSRIFQFVQNRRLSQQSKNKFVRCSRNARARIMGVPSQSGTPQIAHYRPLSIR